VHSRAILQEPDRKCPRLQPKEAGLLRSERHPRNRPSIWKQINLQCTTRGQTVDLQISLLSHIIITKDMRARTNTKRTDLAIPIIMKDLFIEKSLTITIERSIIIIIMIDIMMKRITISDIMKNIKYMMP
jgi:hypothetical protein